MLPCSTIDVKNVSLNYDTKYINWNNHGIKTNYSNYVTELLHKFSLPCDINTIYTTEQSQIFVNSYCDLVCDLLHKASDLAVNSVVRPQQRKKHAKHWWNNDCRISKDRFWYHLWHSCDRPKQGAVYNCYKYSKQVFRKVCRNAFNKSLRFNFNQFDTLYKQTSLM